MPRKLKVYRTAIGFHDAYVAAASQKAALAAWGTDKPLFARGAAEEVADPALTAEPLASPGKVVKRLRGTTAEQMAALPPDRPKDVTAPKKRAAPKRTAPRPSRADLDAAERALENVESQHRAALREIEEQEETLRKKRRDLEADQARERDRLTTARDEAASEYKSALDAWDG